MSKTKNEICERLWSLYQESKESIPLKSILEAFRDELYHGARLALNAETDSAAITTISVSCVQSQVLQSRGKITQTNRLQFTPASEEDKKTIAAMIATEILSMGFSPDENNNLVCMKVTDGINEAMMIAKNPIAGTKVDDIAWVQEPFVLTGERAGKTWADMSAEERIEASRAGLRNPSQMPKYLMARRARIDEIRLNDDGRNTWIEVTYQEIERFEKNEADLKAIREQLGISEESAKSEEAESQGAQGAEEKTVGSMDVDEEHVEGVDLTGVDLEKLHSDVQGSIDEEALNPPTPADVIEELP